MQHTSTALDARLAFTMNLQGVATRSKSQRQYTKYQRTVYINSNGAKRKRARNISAKQRYTQKLQMNIKNFADWDKKSRLRPRRAKPKDCIVDENTRREKSDKYGDAMQCACIRKISVIISPCEMPKLCTYDESLAIEAMLELSQQQEEDYLVY